MTLTEVIDGIGQNTYALEYLGNFLGKDTLFGTTTGVDTGFVTRIAQIMMPAFQGLLVVIVLATIGTGIVKTATEGRFLGKNWHHVGTPAQLVLCIMLLAVSPTNGLSFGQMIYARMLVLGNNFADVTWKDIVENLQDDAMPSDEKTDFKPLVMERFKQSLPMFICDEQLKHDGFDKRNDYQSLRHDACKIPLFETIGLAAAGSQAAQDAAAKLAAHNAAINAGSADPLAVNTDINAAMPSEQEKVEYSCFQEGFKSIKNAEVIKWGTEPLSAPQIDASKITPLLWNTVSQQVSDCVFSNFMSKSEAFKNLNNHNGSSFLNFFAGSTKNPDYAYEKGWGGAALRGDLASQSVSAYKSTYTATPVDAIDVSKIPSHDGMGLTNDAITQTSLNLTKLLANSSINRSSSAPSAPVGGVAANVGGTGFMILGSKTGKIAMNTGVKALEILGKSIKTAEIAAELAKGVRETAEKTGASIPLAGALFTLGAGVAKAATVVFNIPGVSTFLFACGIFLTSAPVIPQAILIIAMFLWVLRAVTWFLMVPFAITIAAIPNTRIGHDAWKELFAIALTPVLIILFYVVGSYGMSSLVDMAAMIVFAYYRDHGAIALIVDLFTGEAIGRLVIFMMIIIAGFSLLSGLILKGPDFIFRILQLRGNFGEMGGELGNIQDKMTGKLRI
jgi:hypothetical protein